MSPEITSSLLLAAALGLGAGLILRLLRQFGQGRKLRFWMFMAVTAVTAYLLASVLAADPGAFWVKLLVSAAVLISANAFLQLVNVLLWDYFLKQRRRIFIPRLIVDVINFALLAFVALGLLKSVFQVNLNAFLVTSTVVSAVVGLSLQDVLGSVVAGLALQMEKPFGVGDWVEIEGEEGQIIQVSWRTVAIRTRSSHMVIFPNSSIAKQSIKNFSRISPFMLKFNVGIGYLHPPGHVKNVLHSAMTESGIARIDPAPQVFLKSYDDFSIEYELRFWIDDYTKKLQVLDMMGTRVWYALRRSGIEIPFPIRDVNVRMIPEDIEQRRESSALEEIYSDLRALPLFYGLSDEQIRMLARSSIIQRFYDGESLVVQGDRGDSMFLVKSGDLRVEIDTGSGSRAVVARLGEGDFFGEMSLLTGEPRSATVLADGEIEVIKLTKDDFSSIIVTDASAVDVLSAALEKRLAEIAESAAKASGSALKQTQRSRADILSKIRGFFGL